MHIHTRNSYVNVIPVQDTFLSEKNPLLGQCTIAPLPGDVSVNTWFVPKLPQYTVAFVWLVSVPREFWKEQKQT